MTSMSMNMTKIKAVGAMALALLAIGCNNDGFEETDWQVTNETEVSPLSRAVEIPTTLPAFRRTYGVGFSYDAIYGEKCNMKDIRCQVFDLAKIEDPQSNGGEKLFFITRDNALEISSVTTFNRSEYVQNTDFKADAEANLILINGKGEGTISLWEGGETNSFFCSSKVISPAMKIRLSAQSIRDLVVEDKHYDLLSKNFLECCNWLEKHHEDAVIDSFLRRYGTHVVTDATVGGRLDILMKMHLDSLLDVMDSRMLGKLSVAEIVKLSGSSESHSKELSVMNSADCQISIRGGNLSLIPADLLHFTFNKHPDLESYAKEWIKSLVYDPDDFQNSNLELCDMNARPIWDFMPNQEVAKKVKARIMATAVELMRELGYQNGVFTSVDLNDRVTCSILGKSTTMDKPAMINVICAGRYVATICRERVPAINKNADVKVLYPIYDREVNLSSGFCIDNGTAYRVRNMRNDYAVDTLGATKETKIYLNCGVPGTAHYDNVSYLESHVVAGIEIPYSVKKDGQIDTSRPYYRVQKSGREFLLWNANGSAQVKGKIDGLPNWTYDSKRNCMVRNEGYKYYWNPKEVSY